MFSGQKKKRFQSRRRLAKLRIKQSLGGLQERHHRTNLVQNGIGEQ